MVLSAVPPPLISWSFCRGDQQMAFTAALCPLSLCSGWKFLTSQTNNLLSLPPEASCWSVKENFKPQT